MSSRAFLWVPSGLLVLDFVSKCWRQACSSLLHLPNPHSSPAVLPSGKPILHWLGSLEERPCSWPQRCQHDQPSCTYLPTHYARMDVEILCRQCAKGQSVCSVNFTWKHWMASSKRSMARKALPRRSESQCNHCTHHEICFWFHCNKPTIWELDYLFVEFDCLLKALFLE